jgi:hypothetical protein
MVKRRGTMRLEWLILPLIVTLWIVSAKAYREHVSRNLSRLAARQLHLSGHVLKTFGSWRKGTGATAFLTPESFFLRTGPGGVQIDRKGTQPERIGLSLFGSRLYADEISLENDHLKIVFSGFVSGTLTLLGLPGEERERVMTTLKGEGALR